MEEVSEYCDVVLDWDPLLEVDFVAEPEPPSGAGTQRAPQHQKQIDAIGCRIVLLRRLGASPSYNDSTIRDEKLSEPCQIFLTWQM